MLSAKKLQFLLLVQIILLIESNKSEGKTKKKLLKSHSPQYEIHPTNQLPSDIQVTTFLYKGQTKTFFYLSIVNNGPLSATVTPCSSLVTWSMKSNFTDKSSPQEATTSTNMKTKYITAVKGWYTLEMTSKERDTYVHVYISTEDGGPQALQNSKHPQLKLLKRQRKNRLTVRWDPSLVDPQGTEYCLTISTRKNYNSLCASEANRFGIIPPKSNKHPVAASQTVIAWQPKNDNIFALKEDPAIICVGKKTHYTISNLKHNQLYFFDVYAINQQTNLTYPYGSTFLKFDKRNKPITLKHDRAAYANLKKLDGKAVFKYKVATSGQKHLNLFVMPCGGSVDVQVTLRGDAITARQRIEGFGKIIVPDVKMGTRYYVKIFSTTREELRKTSGVEVYATSKSTSKIPLPSMPPEPIVKEYVSLRRCNSVTVGWLPSPGQKTSHYCLVIKEGKMREMDDSIMPNQCGLEKRLKKSADFALKYCKDILHNDEQVITERISQLKPGKSYIVQVTVKKTRGKTLSYNLLQVHTSPSCHKLL